MPDPRSAEDALGAYWDALVLGYDATDAGLDRDLAETIRQFQASTETPPPGARERVWAGLSRNGNVVESPLTVSPSQPRPGPSSAPATSANGHRPVSVSTGRESPRPRTFARWVMALLPTAAILLITLAMGFSALWPNRLAPESNALQPPALVRAIEAAPGDGVTELLMETTFTSEELPIGETQIIYYRITLPPGVDLPYLAGPFCAMRAERAAEGAGTEVVQSGAYGLLLDNPLRVRRAGSSVEEEIPAGTKVVLGPGDAAIYPDYTVEGMIRNVGDVPMEIVGVAIVSLEGWGTPAPQLPLGVVAEQMARTTTTDWPSLPVGPKSVSLWRLTLPDDTSIGPYEATGLEAVRVENGTIALGFVQPGESEPFHLPMSHMAGTSIPFLRPSPGVRRTITSVGNQPAVVLALGIEPAMAPPGSLAP